MRAAAVEHDPDELVRTHPPLRAALDALEAAGEAHPTCTLELITELG
jgi:hypothetical protein